MRLKNHDKINRIVRTVIIINIITAKIPNTFVLNSDLVGKQFIRQLLQNLILLISWTISNQAPFL